MSYDYSYDANGNITEIKQNGKLTNKYVYDSLNELKEEYDYVNKFYINYSYDGAGNLQNKYEQVLDPTYGYPTGTQHGNTYEYTDTSWKDKLTKVNGSNISYDANGNPLTYRDGMSFEWENGRILKKISTSDKSVQMSYDSNGMRTQKTVDVVKTNYYYDSNKNLIALVKGNDTLLFYYDSDGSATSFSYNGTMYFYVKNLQGDVIRIIDFAGTEVASYVYDAWGNIKDTKGEPTIREINPIRYRSYVYDTETSLYYLQSRYYDPFTGRFLNADIYCDTNTGTSLSANMFAYCENNPVNYLDPNGYVALVDDLVYALIALSAATVAICSSSFFKKGWSAFCNAVGNGLSSIGNAIWNGASAAWNWSKNKIKNAINAVKKFNTAVSADNKIKSKVKRNSKTRYWSANLKSGYVDIGKSLSYSAAKSYVKSGRSVFTVTDAEAKALAKNASGGKKPVYHTKHKNSVGYYKHYHLYNHSNGAHIWFLY